MTTMAAAKYFASNSRPFLFHTRPLDGDGISDRAVVLSRHSPTSRHVDRFHSRPPDRVSRVCRLRNGKLLMSGKKKIKIALKILIGVKIFETNKIIWAI